MVSYRYAGRNKERKMQNGGCSFGKFNTVRVGWTQVDSKVI